MGLESYFPYSLTGQDSSSKGLLEKKTVDIVTTGFLTRWMFFQLQENQKKQWQTIECSHRPTAKIIMHAILFRFPAPIFKLHRFNHVFLVSLIQLHRPMRKSRVIGKIADAMRVGHTAVGRFRLLVRRSGTRCLTNSEILRVVLTVLGSFLRQSCLVFIMW